MSAWVCSWNYRCASLAFGFSPATTKIGTSVLVMMIWFTYWELHAYYRCLCLTQITINWWQNMPVFFGAGIATRSIKNKTNVHLWQFHLPPCACSRYPVRKAHRAEDGPHWHTHNCRPDAHWVVLYRVQQPACANGFSLMATDNLCTNMSVQWSTIIENDETHCSHTHWQYLMQPLNKDYKL